MVERKKWGRSEAQRTEKRRKKEERKQRRKALRSRLGPRIDYRARNASLASLGYPSYRHYLDSDLWKDIRERVRARDKGRCALCGKPGYQVHHLAYDMETLKGECLDRLATICAPCHRKIELKADGRKRNAQSVAARFVRLASRLIPERP